MQRKVIARYYVTGPHKETVTHTKHSIEDENGVARIVAKEVTEELECYHVTFPKGHSIRLTSLEKLKELGFDKKPRMIDGETGDVVDLGGDPFEFVHENAKAGSKSRTADSLAA